MYLRDMYKKNKIVISFEVFPPKKEYDISKLYDTILDLKSLDPNFVSVTYGAGGGTKAKTVEIASTIKNMINTEAVAHFTCVNSTKSEITDVLNQLKKNNIKNILALRGDPPAGQKNFTKMLGGFEYAFELVRYIKNHNDWSIAVAGYPEGHPDTKNLKEDINYLKMKVDSGADVVITQIFFDNTNFYKFREIAAKKGINVPIIPGVFPILNFKTIQKITSLCGARIPDVLYKKLLNAQDAQYPIEETEKIGIDYAIKQSEDLLNNGIQCLHFYTMNKSKQIKQIFSALTNRF